MSDLSSVDTLLTRTNDLLAVLVKVALRDALSEELKNPKKRKLYELTGGDVPVKELSTKLGLGTGTISRIWQSWEQSGLIVKRTRNTGG